jgi:hypothetical protein
MTNIHDPNNLGYNTCDNVKWRRSKKRKLGKKGRGKT